MPVEEVVVAVAVELADWVVVAWEPLRSPVELSRLSHRMKQILQLASDPLSQQPFKPVPQ
jgi:hypothetical protein